MQYSLSETMDIMNFVEKIKIKYPQYFTFVEKLPDVIFINEGFGFGSWRGLKDISRIPPTAIEVLKYDNFLEESPIQPRLMIVGHNPTRNYCKKIASVNPIFDWQKKILSIDGGNNVVKGGQLNVVLMDNLKNKNVSFCHLIIIQNMRC